MVNDARYVSTMGHEGGANGILRAYNSELLLAELKKSEILIRMSLCRKNAITQISGILLASLFLCATSKIKRKHSSVQRYHAKTLIKRIKIYNVTKPKF
jgi:hypothetical protein